MSATKLRRSVAGPQAEGERHQGFRAVGLSVAKLAAPILARRGGGLVFRLKADWPAIAGADWAGVAWPAALGRDGALRLNTLPVAALELQHITPPLIERINGYFGRAAVTRIVFVQAVWSSPPQLSGPAPRLPMVVEAETFDQRLAQIADCELRAALARFGRAIREAAG